MLFFIQNALLLVLDFSASVTSVKPSSSQLKDFNFQPLDRTFPTKNFLNVSTYAEGGLTSQGDAMLCQNKDEKSRCCLCNYKHCMKYGYCCKDVLWQYNKRQAIESYIGLLVNQSKQFKHTKCEGALPFISNVSPDVQEYMMVTTC